MNNEIDISNFISVSISSAPSSMSERNVANICIVTKETPNNPIGSYVMYKNATDMANDWGTNSNVYKIGNAIFCQNQNILAANGSVYVVPMLKSVSNPATNGTLTCLSPLLENFVKVDNGELRLKVDGVEVSKDGLNFTACESLEQVANVFNVSLLDNNVNATVVDGDFIFNSLTTGATSKVELLTIESPTGTDLADVYFLNKGKAVAKNGRDAYTGVEKLDSVLLRAQEMFFYGSLIPAYIPEDVEAMDAAESMQSLNHLLILAQKDVKYINGEKELFSTIKSKRLTKTRCLYHSSEPLEMCGAYCGYYQSINFNGNNTMLNLHSKELIGITPDGSINQTLLNSANNIGVDLYIVVGGIGAVFCSGENEWFDTSFGLLWLKIGIENAGFNCLRQVPSKIPQTENGMDLLKSAYKKVLYQGVVCGLFAPGTWTLPFTFGDQKNFYSNIETSGYYIYSMPVATQSQSERDKRRAPVIQMAMKLSGAINSSNVICYINN